MLRRGLLMEPRTYRILKDPLNQDIGRMLVASVRMQRDFAEELPQWVADGLIEWVDETKGGL